MDGEITALINHQSLSALLQYGALIDTREAWLSLGLLVISLCLGILLNRIIDRFPQRNWRARAVDFLAPLLSSLLAMILVTIGLSVYRYYEIDPTLLPLTLKLAVSWFAIRVVLLMSSRKTAGWFVVLVIAPITLLQLFGIWKPLTKMLKSWEFSVGTVDVSAYAIVKTIAAVCILFWLAGVISRIVEQRLRRIRSLRASNRALILKIFQIALYVFVFMMVLQVMGINLTALSVFGGALGVGLGFGLQKIASNFISGIILLFEKSIQVDDMIELENGTMGFVRHTGARYTLIETTEGKDILIPNEDFITQRMVNWTYSSKKARVEIKLSISYTSDLHTARRLMLEAAAANPRCIKDPKPLCVVDNFGDSGIGLILHFWIPDVTDGRMEPKSDVMISIWDQFQRHNITLATPQKEIRILKPQDEQDGLPIPAKDA
jgi:small-conductance mechanosensitive channel